MDIARLDNLNRGGPSKCSRKYSSWWNSWCAMADFEEASAAGFQHVYPNASIAGCWFHYAQAIIIKRTNKIGLKEAYGRDEDVQNVGQCLVSLLLLPLEEM